MANKQPFYHSERNQMPHRKDEWKFRPGSQDTYDHPSGATIARITDFCWKYAGHPDAEWCDPALSRPEAERQALAAAAEIAEMHAASASVPSDALLAEIDVMQTIVVALAGLTAPERERVIAWAVSKFGKGAAR